MLLDERIALRELGLARGDRNVGGVEIRRERHLRIDRDRLPAWEVHDHVRSEALAVDLDRLLRVEVHAVEHARRLGDAPQLQLAPATALIVALQHLAELRRRLADLLAGESRVLELLGERGMLLGALRLELLDARLHLVDGVLDGRQRLEHGVLRLLALLPRLRLLVHRDDLLLEAVERGVGGGELGPELSASGRRGGLRLGRRDRARGALALDGLRRLGPVELARMRRRGALGGQCGPRPPGDDDPGHEHGDDGSGGRADRAGEQGVHA